MGSDLGTNRGDVVRIHLSEGACTFARILHGPLFAFYALQLDAGADVDINEITSSPVLFTVPVMSHAVESGRWPVIGSKGLEAYLQQPVVMFKQDAINKSLSLYIEAPNGEYEERPATREECVGLERAAVWNPEHVEDRLRDHFSGVPNRWVESMKVK